MAISGKKAKYIGWTIAAIVLMSATVPAAIWVTNTQSAKLGNARARCQRGQHRAHQVNIKNGLVAPQRTMARKCDTLIITNLDARDRLMAFGPHDNHISYDGVSERLLAQGQSLTVTLVTPGLFVFHDHADPAVWGSFNVSD